MSVDWSLVCDVIKQWEKRKERKMKEKEKIWRWEAMNGDGGKGKWGKGEKLYFNITLFYFILTCDGGMKFPWIVMRFYIIVYMA